MTRAAAPARPADGAVRFEVLAPEDAFTSFAPAWRELLAASDADTLFLSPDWMEAWWSAYGASRTPLVVAAFRNGRPAALLPLHLAEERYRGVLGLRTLRFLGDGTHDSDYLDFIIPRGEAHAVLPAFWSWIEENGAGFDVARLNELPSSSPHVPILRAMVEPGGRLLDEERIGCVRSDLPDSWERYVAGLKPRMRTKVRSLPRELESGHRVRLLALDREDDLEERLASLFTLHALRWESRGESGVFRDARKRAFYHALARVFLRRGGLRFHTLEVDGRPVAHQFCLGYGGTVYLLQEAYDPEWQEQGVGNVLRSLVFQRLIDEGWRAYDFLGGVSAHKLSWGGEVRESLRWTIRGRGPKGAIVSGATRLANAVAPMRARLRGAGG